MLELPAGGRIRLRSSIHQFPPVSIAETLALGCGIVDLWYFLHDEIDDAELLAAHEALMTPDERKRHQRFHFERDRRLFVATRALVRTVLSSYAAVAPADWRFGVGEHGKPRVVHPAVRPLIHFNLANTPGLVVCLVSIAHQRIGVDAERTDHQTETPPADWCFSASEVKALRTLPAFTQSQRFFAYWTLKECYVKARGLGLALPLDQFSFLVDDHAIRLSFDDRLGDDATRWRFALLDVPARYLIAVGVDTGGAALSLRVAHLVPLRGNTAAPIPTRYVRSLGVSSHTRH